MIRGLYTSAMGMATQKANLDVVANNIANANTNGFRGATAYNSSFPEMLMNRLHAEPGHPTEKIIPIGGVGHGVTMAGVHTNFAQGPLELTHGEFDVAIAGQGFFAVESNIGGTPTRMFTRNGAFTITPERILVNHNGDRILDTNGNPITIPDGTMVIEASGQITVNEVVIATLGVTNFDDPTQLRQHGYTLFAQHTATEIPFEGAIEQGFLERSNVNITREMVNMINISRAFELNQRMVGIQDQTLQQAVNEIARR